MPLDEHLDKNLTETHWVMAGNAFLSPPDELECFQIKSASFRVITHQSAGSERPWLRPPLVLMLKSKNKTV